ncbi:MAG: YeeE/YedE family protein [Hyphomicrobiaceae bacterium]|nr:YeeE/YedE family protein [Hyphomicrobiaceae bacterium]
MSLDLTFAAIAALAFAFGFVSQRSSICGVLAARQIVETGGTSRLKAFMIAALWAFAFAIPLAWLAPQRFALMPSVTGAMLAVVGGALYGLGTIINGACVFGTASRVLTGNLSFAAALPGIAGGGAIAGLLQLSQLQGARSPSPLIHPSSFAWLLLVIVAILAVAALTSIMRSYRRAGLGIGRVLRAARWRTSLAMMMIGVIGGILFALSSGWSYPSLMRQVGRAAIGLPAAFPLVTMIGPLALVAGGIGSIMLGGHFVLRRISLLQVARSAIGGLIMASAAALIPGGNDVMLLAGLPSLAMHVAVAYSAMLAVQLALLWSVRQIRLARSTA